MIRRSGVVIALPFRADRTTVFEQCARSSVSADLFSAGERDVVAAFGFEDGETVLAVSHIGAGAASERPDVAQLLGHPVVDAVRVESFVSPTRPDAALRAEVLLVRVARDIANLYGGIVCDDVGAIYERDDLDDLVARGLPREASFAFGVAAMAALNAGRGYPLPTHIDLPDLDPALAPSECAPDVALDIASIVVVRGPHVPVIAAARIAVLAGLRAGLPLVVFAPELGLNDAAILRAAGLIVCVSSEELEATLELLGSTRTIAQIIAPNSYGREEIALYAAGDLNLDVLRIFTARRSFDVAELAGADAGDQPAIVLRDAGAAHDVRLPVRLARFAFRGAILDLYHLDVLRAHPLLAALMGARAEVASLVPDARYAVVCESLVERDAGAASADVLSISLLGELALRAPCVAQDDSGALFDATGLARMAARRRGRSSSWNEDVALAELVTR
jgi:hypothetical protein